MAEWRISTVRRCGMPQLWLHQPEFQDWAQTQMSPVDVTTCRKQTESSATLSPTLIIYAHLCFLQTYFSCISIPVPTILTLFCVKIHTMGHKHLNIHTVCCESLLSCKLMLLVCVHSCQTFFFLLIFLKFILELPIFFLMDYYRLCTSLIIKAPIFIFKRTYSLSQLCESYFIIICCQIIDLVSTPQGKCVSCQVSPVTEDLFLLPRTRTEIQNLSGSQTWVRTKKRSHGHQSYPTGQLLSHHGVGL